MSDREFILSHASLTGSKEYECDLCGEEFVKRMNHAKHGLVDKVRAHLEDEHPDALERDTYPNEEAFREWADKCGYKVHEPRVPGEPLFILRDEMKQIKLYSDGSIILEAQRHLGGGPNGEVRVEGSRLVTEDNRGNRAYVSQNAFPVKKL